VRLADVGLLPQSRLLHNFIPVQYHCDHKMMGFVPIGLLTLALIYIVKCTLGLRRHAALAKTTGLPYHLSRKNSQIFLAILETDSP